MCGVGAEVADVGVPEVLEPDVDGSPVADVYESPPADVVNAEISEEIHDESDETLVK